ncbi:branched-chain amino acid ABC transporter permease [Candidatus Woesearchaeota archaeon]|nr:branched-chain amino acid ABC transporter permease [Candidatus Woesearchaeota archaeon]
MAFINYVIHILNLTGIFGILTISLNLSVGFTGLLNLGHVGFFGIGAYTTALLALNGVPLILSLLIGSVVSFISGIILGLPTLRLKSDYLALATLGFSFILSSLAKNWIGLTRGALGLPGIPRLIHDNTLFLWIVFGILIVVYLLVFLITRSRFGKVCEAIRDDELAAKILGKNTFLHKILILGISAFFAGLAGGLFASYLSFVDPSIFGLGDLILIFSALIIGGLASVKGSFLGIIILMTIPEPLRFIGFPIYLIGPAREIIFGIILLLILIHKPRGIFGRADIS